jgi:chromosome segregation ATPase
MGFLPSSAFYILIFILFILIFIYGYKLSQSIDINKLKKLIHHINKPEDVRNFENQVNIYITNFENKARSLEQALTDIQMKLNEFSNLLNQRQSTQQLRKQIQQILNRLQQQQILPQLLQYKIQILIQASLQNIRKKDIENLINELRNIKQQQQLSNQNQKDIGKLIKLINLLNQLGQQKQLLRQLKRSKKEIKKLLKDFDKQYKDFNDDYNNIVNFINVAITNFQQNYNNQGIIRFLTNKKNELENIKRNTNNKIMMILNNPDAQKLINNYIKK